MTSCDEGDMISDIKNGTGLPAVRYHITLITGCPAVRYLLTLLIVLPAVRYITS
jgi:hypothetical protein